MLSGRTESDPRPLDALQSLSPVLLSIDYWPLPTMLLSYLESTLMKSPVSVATKELAGSLSPLVRMKRPAPDAQFVGYAVNRVEPNAEPQAKGAGL